MKATNSITSFNNHQLFVLQQGDTTLILAQRSAEWCGHGPVLEQDIAITNITLDLLGQSRAFYQYAAELINKQNGNESATEDTLAYLRDVREFRNHLIAELPNGDWAKTILRLFFFSVYQYHLFNELQKSKDMQLASIAIKSLKEVAYHRRWSSEWVIRLGDGTEESRERIQNALNELWAYTGEFFVQSEYEKEMTDLNIGADLQKLKVDWEKNVNEVLTEATLATPQSNWFQTGGKEGRHTEHLGYILADLQFLQRAYPASEW